MKTINEYSKKEMESKRRAISEHFGKKYYEYEKYARQYLSVAIKKFNLSINMRESLHQDMLHELYLSLVKSDKRVESNFEMLEKNELDAYIIGAISTAIRSNTSDFRYKEKGYASEKLVDVRENLCEFDLSDNDEELKQRISIEFQEEKKLRIIEEALKDCDLEWYNIKIFKLYFEDPKATIQSLSDQYNINRSAVHKMIKKVENYLIYILKENDLDYLEGRVKKL